MKETVDLSNRFLGAVASGSSRRVATAVLMIIIAAITAYHTTVAGIELALSEKADRAVVETLEQRYLTIETLLRTDVAQRSEFIDWRDEMQRRLTRIETLLEQVPAHRKGSQP